MLQVQAAAGGGASLMTGANGEPKGQLNQFCQRYCKRPITKEDVVYTSAKFGEVYQVTLTLNCIEGQQFVGETAATPKEAEKNAAVQALIHFQPLADTLPPSTSKNKKRKATTEGAEGEAALKVAKAGESGDPNANSGLTDKVLLNTALMKILKMPMTKKEIVYETTQTPVGYQSTVRLPCLPGEWGELAWAGEVSQNQKEAEVNAAKQALEAVNQGMESIKALVPQASKQAAPKSKGQGGFQGKGCGGMPANAWELWQAMKGMMQSMDMGGMGKGMGMSPPMGKAMGKAMGMMGGKGGASVGKDGGAKSTPKGGPQPKMRISEAPITGEVIEWKGNYGWVKPHVEIQHPMAKKRQGKVFIGKSDVVGGANLSVGGMVSFHVYEDPSGLGAEEVTAF